jgi:hypothetical protein
MWTESVAGMMEMAGLAQKKAVAVHIHDCREAHDIHAIRVDGRT